MYSYFAPRVFRIRIQYSGYLCALLNYTITPSLKTSPFFSSYSLLLQENDACVCASVCVVPAEYLRGEAAVLSRSTRAGRPLPESWGPSDKRDEERGVVTLGAGAGRCPGPAAAEVANQDCSGRTALVKEPSACAMGSSSRTLLMAVWLRY